MVYIINFLYSKRTLKGLIWGHIKPSISFDEPPIAVSKFLNVAAHRPLKV